MDKYYTEILLASNIAILIIDYIIGKNPNIKANSVLQTIEQIIKWVITNIKKK